jgi:hypothetical protein
MESKSQLGRYTTMTAPSLVPHEAADALRTVALWLDSGQIVHPDDAPRTFTAENVHGFDVLVQQYPDGTTTLATRSASWHSWGPPVELVQAETIDKAERRVQIQPRDFHINISGEAPERISYLADKRRDGGL